MAPTDDARNERTPLLRHRNIPNQESPPYHHEDYVDREPTDEPLEEDKLINAKYQSLDYDVCENVLYQEEEKVKGYKAVLWQHFMRWLVMLLIGIFTGLIATFIDVCIRMLSEIKYSNIKKSFDHCYHGGCLSFSLFIWIGLNAGAVMIASIFVAYGEPVAAGSGIPQIKCFLNGIKIPHVVRIKTLAAKVFGVILSVVGGLAIGKEGPMIHSGAVVAAGISQGRSTSLRFDFKVFDYFRTDKEKRDFVAGGAAAGVAAAFGAPVGGVLFSLEEGASFWNQGLTWRIFFASMMSAFTLSLLQSVIKGEPWHLSFNGLINFGTFTEQELDYIGWEILIFIGMGVIGGLSGALFNHINEKLTVFRKRFVYRPWTQVIEAMLVASLSAVTAFQLMYFVKDCQAIGKDPNENTLQVHCDDGQYNTMASLWMQTPEEGVKSLFHDQPDSYRPETVVIFAVFYFFLACWTYGLSVPSGLFIPCLLIGAAWGRLVGILMHHLTSWGNPGKYALIGAAAQLGGVVRMTISLTVILIEATGNITFGLPIMIVLMVAKWVGDLFNEGLYDIHIQLAGVPLLPWEPPPMSSNIMAAEVMSYPVETIKTVDTVRKIVELLHNKKMYNGFPVVDDTIRSADSGDYRTFGYLRGFILRSQLLVLLQNKAFSEVGGTPEGVPKLKAKDFRDPYPRFPNVERIHISIHELECSIDLRPFMNPAPFAVSLNASLPRMFRLFRGLGLRHIVVVNGFNEVVGVVARKDLARYRLSSHSGSIGLQELQISLG